VRLLTRTFVGRYCERCEHFSSLGLLSVGTCCPLFIAGCVPPARTFLSLDESVARAQNEHLVLCRRYNAGCTYSTSTSTHCRSSCELRARSAKYITACTTVLVLYDVAQLYGPTVVRSLAARAHKFQLVPTCTAVCAENPRSLLRAGGPSPLVWLWQRLVFAWGPLKTNK
jgi:hypothetical protein